MVLVKLCHAKALQVWIECHLREVLTKSHGHIWMYACMHLLALWAPFRKTDPHKCLKRHLARILGDLSLALLLDGKKD